MSYDEQSQMGNKRPCIAKSNSPLSKTTSGIMEYLKLGIAPSKLILGVPWYGYHYPCLALKNDTICVIKSVPFRGSACSDAAGTEVAYFGILDLLRSTQSKRHWDMDSQSPYFNVKYGLDKTVQVRYDDPKSLGKKYELVTELGLAGAGMWTANYLNYSVASQIKEMWDILP